MTTEVRVVLKKMGLGSNARGTILPWVRKWEGIHGHTVSYSLFKARLKHTGACPRLVNLIATPSSNHKKNLVLPGQSRLLMEGFFLPLCSGFTEEVSCVGGCFVNGFPACCGMVLKFSTLTNSAMAAFRFHSPLRIL